MSDECRDKVPIDPVRMALHTVEFRMARVEADMHEIRLAVKEIDEAIDGCGETPGLRMQIDRLMQSRLSERDRLALYIAPVITGVIIAVASCVVTWMLK